MYGTIEPFIHKRVVVLNKNDSVLEAARAMCENEIGSVIVSNSEGQIAGIVTDRDLACGVASETESTTKLSELISSDLIFVNEDAPLIDVVSMMKKFGVRRIPVLEQTRGGTRERCVGIVTLDDLLAAQLLDPKEISDIVKNQVFHKFRSLRAKRRSDARTEQTYEEFFNEICQQTGLSKDDGESFGRFVLSAIARRMHYTGAAHFIAQLPSQLHDQLMALPAGPDRSITGASLLEDITSQFSMDEAQAKTALKGVWQALANKTSPGQLKHVKNQLPKSLLPLFVDSQDLPPSSQSDYPESAARA